MGSKMTEGAAIDVVLPAGAAGVTKGELYRISKWNGFAMSTVLPTDPELGFALQVDQEVWWVSVGSTAALGTVVMGDVLWWSAGEGFKKGSTDLIDAGAGGLAAACKVVVAPDANGIAGVRALNLT